MVSKKILMCGNEVIAEAAIGSGCRFYAGYPITPQNELTAHMAKRMREVGGVFIQSESELAAINMVLGASAAGARAMTSSSSPGISLKQEGISYLAGCQLPAVIVNIMRGGPGLGNIAPAQSDYFQAVKGGGHGDYHLIVLAPASLDEAAELTHLAFDLADKYRNPVMILGDGILGQMVEPIEEKKLRVTSYRLPVTKKWALTGCKGRAPNVVRSFFIAEGELEKHNELLQKKYDKIKKDEARFEETGVSGASLVIVAYGTASRICRAAIKAAKAAGHKVGMVRPITLWPFPGAPIRKAAESAKTILVVEMSAGQFVEDVRLAVEGDAPVKFYGRTGGGVPTVEGVLGEIEKLVA